MEAAPQSPPGETKPLEVLIHNVSHKDLLMTVCRAEHASGDGELCRRAKPAFSAFAPISKAIYRLLDPSAGGTVAASAEDLVESPANSPAAAAEDAAAAADASATLTTGMRVPSAQPLRISGSREPSAHGLRARDVVLQAPLPSPAPRPASSGGDGASSEDGEEEPDSLRVQQVHFPLIAVLVPRWLEISYDKSCRQRVYLISGSCTPRDPDADMSDNSTVRIPLSAAFQPPDLSRLGLTWRGWRGRRRRRRS